MQNISSGRPQELANTAIARVSAIGRELAVSFQGLVDAIPGRPRRPLALARELKVDKSAAHRLVTAIRESDPLATVHLLPGPEALRRVARAARDRAVPATVADRADAAVAAFETIIDEEGGDRAGLDALISSRLPSAREHLEKTAKHTLNRGARQLKGVSAEVSFASHLLFPSDDGVSCDAADILGHLGLRRSRPNAALSLGLIHGTNNQAGRTLTLKRTPALDPHDIIWHRFCSQPEVELIVRPIPGSLYRCYDLQWHDAVGPHSARNVVFGDLTLRAIRRYRQLEDPRPKAAISDYIVVPARMMIIDVLLHEDLYPDWSPEILTIETGGRGLADPNDPSRAADILPVAEQIEPLGSGIDCFWDPEVADYTEMLSHACGQLGWNLDSFRGYRATIKYPIYGSQIMLSYDVPISPPSA